MSRLVHTRIRLGLSLILILGLLSVSGCSISKSLSSPSRWSGKSSKSSSSPSRSSSASSKDDDAGSEAPATPDVTPEAAPAPVKEETSYFQDIRDYTASAVAANGTPAALASGLGPLARTHGILDWESDPATLRAIGAGVARAGLSPRELEGYKQFMSDGELTRIQLIQDGYDSAGKLTSQRR